MVPIDDAKAAALLTATEAKLSPAKEPAEAGEPAVETVAESGPASESTPAAPAAAETKAKAPDLTHLPAEIRETYRALPPEMQKGFDKIRATALTELNKTLEAKAKADAAAAKWTQLESDPTFRQDLAAARRLRLEGARDSNDESKKVEKPKYFEATDEDAFDQMIEGKIRQVVEPMLTADERHAQAVDSAIDSYRASLNGVVESEVLEAGIKALSDDLTAQHKGRPYKGIKPEDVAKVLPAYVRAAKAEAQLQVAAASRESTPPPLTAKAASIKGLGTNTATAPPTPQWKKDGKPPTPEQYWRDVVIGQSGLTDEQLSRSRVGGVIRP